MTILITGGSGFVGLNIAEQLLKSGDSVVLFSLQDPPGYITRYLQSLPGGLTVTTGNVLDGEDLLQTMQKYEVDQVVHGAAITAALSRELNEASTIAAVNLGGTIEVLEAACQHSIGRVILLGSGSIYGEKVKASGYLDEVEDVPIPDSLYGITKYAAERTAVRYRAARSLDVVVARLGVVFGRWEYDTGVRDTLSVPHALTQLAEFRSHARLPNNLPDDWVYSGDTADAVIRLLRAQSISEPVYNVSTGRRWSVPDFCDRLREHFPGFSYEFVSDPAEANVGQQTPLLRPPFSIHRLQRDTGFEPRFLEGEAVEDYLLWRTEYEGGVKSD